LTSIADRDASVTSDTVTLGSDVDRRPPLRRGATVGRYIVIDRAGEGGMGVVYKAYDPELERAVALKLLHSGPREGDDAERRRARLVREARALARLSHPNVIAVHDVGTFDGDVFIATEFVEGAPLKSWLLTAKPSVEEILRVMTAAGEGLAAAHRSALVHRDFKPGNLLVGNDGRARVLDFGLARADVDAAMGADAEMHADAGAETSAPSPSTDAPLTRAGQVLGTPRYMAPEQHLGRELDARSDQFSFCATLYEALYGEPPFDPGGDDYRTNVTAGRLRAVPADARVPRRLRQILARGLAVNPQDRWPSMDALLAELRRDPVATRRREIVLAVSVIAAAAVAALAIGATRRTAPVCPAGVERLAGVWDTDRKHAVAGAFAATGAAGSTDAYARVERSLDDYASRWTAMRTDACMATRA
jgi:serine/threonine protein kinase